MLHVRCTQIPCGKWTQQTITEGKYLCACHILPACAHGGKGIGLTVCMTDCCDTGRTDAEGWLRLVKPVNINVQYVCPQRD